jgi:hypothetical protein
MGGDEMTKANSHAEITGLQRWSIRAAAERVGATENEMAGFFLGGGEWDASPGAELEELLVECWQESIFENQ